jgi:UrcA family protein
MITRFIRRSAAVLAGVTPFLILAGSPASAQEGPIIVVTAPPPNVEVNVARVPYWDIDLATPAGEQLLVTRVDSAVERVCQRDRDRWYGLSEPGYLNCTARAWQGAQPQIAEAIYSARQLAYNSGYYYYGGQ